MWNTDSLWVEVAEDVKIELEVTSDGEKGKAGIEVSMSWRHRREEEAVQPASLTIVPGAAPAEPVATLAE